MIDFIKPECTHSRRKKSGLTKSGTQRYKCLDCGKRFTESTATFAGMQIGMETAVAIISQLCEGTSVRATARLVGVDVKTVLELLLLVGPRCKAFLESKIQNVEVSDVQCDEIWQFVYCKRRTARKLEPETGHGGPCGDSWCWTAVERHTKLILCFHVGRRTDADADAFTTKLRYATAPKKFQISTDGLSSYVYPIAHNLGERVDYGRLIKIYKGGDNAGGRYSPPRIAGAKRETVHGNPDDKRICTSHVERTNGSIRCFSKRYGRLTYCFSKKWENHECAVALQFAHFNFCRKHKTLKATPAMASKLADHVWTVEELLTAIAA
ncbi:IS1/IS1595 family N-terminal zinc-binding domain-containing protein [Anatilimnocola floriformis]|uniref:IS1/IS1595 family N-terminal zinc-binding domain-containing protein n=1 Tax=Anatilimnocola floriformis TaxID=2948575 RepID=UPI0020C4D270|nr:hypothetical protein [Anatilimnocola floriformis]